MASEAGTESRQNEEADDLGQQEVDRSTGVLSKLRERWHQVFNSLRNMEILEQDINQYKRPL